MALKESIRHIIDDPDHFTGKVFAFAIQILIVISLITFSIDTLPDLSPGTKEFLRLIEVITVVIFSLEYVLRLVVA